MPANRLFYGDNLDVLRQHIATDSVDLVYLDPPFNSSRNYNVIFGRHADPSIAIDIEPRDGPQLTKLTDWLYNSGRYRLPAVTEFLAAADYLLVAQAATRGSIVVTHEIPSVGRRVKIPDACHAMSVSWMDPFTMLRTEKAQFHLR